MTPGFWYDQRNDSGGAFAELKDPEEGAGLVIRTSSGLDPLN